MDSSDIVSADFGGRRLRRRITRWIVAIVALLVIFWAVPQLLQLYTEWLWFSQDVGYPHVFSTILLTRIGLGLFFGLLFAVLLLVNVWIARRFARRADWYTEETALRRQIAAVMEYFASRYLYLTLVVFALVVGYFVGLAASTQWDAYLQFRRAVPFGGAPDPVFTRDIGFYTFRLPFWQYLWQWAYIALIAVFIITALVHYLDKAIRMLRGVPALAGHVKVHLSLLLALILVMKALGYRLDRYSLLYSDHPFMNGASYTDVNAHLLSYTVLFWIALAVALIVLISAFRRGLWAPLAGIGFMLVVSFLLSVVYPAIVQQFQVAPAEFQREQPYIESAIAFTHRAYGLGDAQNTRLSQVAPLTTTQLAGNLATLENVRLWDYRPLLTTYERQQALQPYYRFNSVDIDRYTVKGRYRQVMLAARELALTEKQAGWQNEHMYFTHGYGIVMSPVSDTVATGLPDYWISDIPPQSPAGMEGLKVTRPGIYYGELTTDYVIVGAKPDETDYGVQDAVKTTRYAGKGGVHVGSLLPRMAAALRFLDYKLLISNQIKGESRLLWGREIQGRARHIAPFLSYDNDPYIVLGDDGHLYWINDAYTTSSAYPYSAFYGTEESGQINYIRNSVKVVTDAYDGTVDFYIADPKDPILQVYRRIFPDLFKPLADLPAGLGAHLRYPEGLYNAQSTLLTTYHVTNPQVFYNNSERWEIAREAAKTVGEVSIRGNENSESMQAYYAILSLPGRKTPEFLLMLPFTPQGKTNLAAWFAGECDGDAYGQKLLYEYPRSEQIWGPIQIEGVINQNTEFSKIKTLLGQQGSTFTPGNLLVLPMDTSLLYVEPYYISSTTGAIPELKYVVVARGDGRVAFGSTFSEALTNLLGVAPPQTVVREATGVTPVTPPPAAGQPAPPTPSAAKPLPTDVKGLAKRASDEYNEALDKQKKGDWAGYGDALRRLQKTLGELERRTK